MPVIPTSRMQSSSVGCVRIPTARQIASALERDAEDSDAALTEREGILRLVNFVVLSPGQ
jgi:hypothetical protein